MFQKGDVVRINTKRWDEHNLMRSDISAALELWGGHTLDDLAVVICTGRANTTIEVMFLRDGVTDVAHPTWWEKVDDTGI